MFMPGVIDGLASRQAKRIVSRTQRFFDSMCGLLLHVGEQVRVGIQRDGYVRVTRHL